MGASSRMLTGSGYEKSYDLDELEVNLDELEQDLCDISAAMTKLERSKSELVEFQLVLDRAGSFFDTARRRANLETGTASASVGDEASLMEAPLIDGNQYTSSMQNVTSPSNVNMRLGFIAGLIPQVKICDAFSANRYPLPEEPN